MTEQCPKCLRMSNVRTKYWKKEDLTVTYFCSKCNFEWDKKYDCGKCNCSPKYHKVHCNNDHMFSIYHNCKLRKMGEIEKS